MSDGSNDWEQQDAPMQESWEKDPGEYGLEVSADWDDYSSEQGITAPPPPPQPVADPQDTQLGQAAASSVEPPAMPSEAPESDLAAEAASVAESAAATPIAETAAPMAGWASLFRTTPEEPKPTDGAAADAVDDVSAVEDVTEVSMPVVSDESVAGVAADSHEFADSAVTEFAADSAASVDDAVVSDVAEVSMPVVSDESVAGVAAESHEFADSAVTEFAADSAASVDDALAADVAEVSMPVVSDESVADVAATDFAADPAAPVDDAPAAAAPARSLDELLAAIAPAASAGAVPAAAAQADVADVATPVGSDDVANQMAHDELVTDSAAESHDLADAAATDFAAAPEQSAEQLPDEPFAADPAASVDDVSAAAAPEEWADVTESVASKEPVTDAAEPKFEVSDEPLPDAAADAASAAAATTAGEGASSDTQTTSVTRWPSLDRVPAPGAETADLGSPAQETAAEEPQTGMRAVAAAGVAAGVGVAASAHGSWDDATTEVVNQPTRAAAEPVTGQAEAPADSAPVVAAAGAAGVAAAGAAIYREDEETRQLPVTDPAAEQAALEEKLRQERQARDERLGVVPPVPENEKQQEAKPARRSTDGFFGSFGLFVLRLVAAAILGVIGYQILTPVDRTVEFLSKTVIPEPRLVAWILGFALGAMALLLIIGLMQRFVGLLMMLLGIGSLVFIRWGSFLPFLPGQEGFVGDRDLLLAAVGLLLLTLGGGTWGIDGAIRRSRSRRSDAKPNQ